MNSDRIRKTNIREKINSFPNNPGVYLMKDSTDTIIYIGKAKNLKKRITQYFSKTKKDIKTEMLISNIDKLDFIITENEMEALILEANLIKFHKPKYNIVFKDDKSYPYIKITKEPYPRIFLTREKKHDASEYFGPFTGARNVKHILRTLKSIFRIRSCSKKLPLKNKVRPCINYQINKCLGPCANKISQEKYNELIASIRDFLNGKYSHIIKEFQKRMEIEAEKQNYEEAARYRDMIYKIENISKYNQNVRIESNIFTDIIGIYSEDISAEIVVLLFRNGRLIGKKSFFIDIELYLEKNLIEEFIKLHYSKSEELPDEIVVPVIKNKKEMKLISSSLKKLHRKKLIIREALDKENSLAMANAKLLLKEHKIKRMRKNELIDIENLRKALKMKNKPTRIEGFDISNFQGKQAVASMVSFYKGEPDKSNYRHYKIKTVKGINDFLMMEEVIRRRYTRLLKEKKSLPDLILIDGGKGQVSSAYKIIKELKIDDKVVICGIAKKNEEIYLPKISKPLVLDRDANPVLLLRRVRDEAHRFAISYHKKIRDKKTLIFYFKKKFCYTINKSFY